MMAIVSSMLVERTERGDQMFMTMLQRHSQHVLDTNALATLPKPGAPEPLQPSADDEGAHQPGAEPLWSESWYADFVDEQQGIGGWFRLGLMPNQQTAWVNALLCGPDIPTVAVIDFEASLPDDPGVVRTDAVELTQGATDPLRTYHVRLRGRGQAYDDPSALLQGQPGRPVELSMELVWTTVGIPYQYRLTPRYEIPCTVSGTVSLDGAAIGIEAVAGQRDHSWGERDWWSMDWVWSALHLRDGTHLHGVDLRIPGSSTDRCRLHPATRWHARRAASGRGAGNVRRQRLTRRNRVVARARQCDRVRPDHGPCTGAADRNRWPTEPLPARVGDSDDPRRRHRGRLAGVEPQPTMTVTCTASGRVCTRTRRKK